MKKTAILFLLGLFYINGFGQDNVYRDTMYPFSISYPKTWRKTEPFYPQHSGTRLFIVSDSATLTIDVIRSKEFKSRKPVEFVNYMLSPALDLTAFVRQGLETIVQNRLPGTQIKSKGKIYLGKQAAFYVISETGEADLDHVRRTSYYQIFMTFEDNFYTLTFRCSGPVMDLSYSVGLNSRLPGFRLIAETFVVKSALRKASKKTKRH